MKKYNFDLDLVSDNSNSLIIREIENNSSVLEFGSAHGRMTKYLKETMNCNVSIIEYDIDSGNESKKFADFSIIGPEANLNENNWCFYIKQKYKYIIFADVLEHLYDPKNVLLRSIDFLENDGTILISVPNVSHNSILIDLFNNKFDYKEVGLLDNTHIKFFTRSSLEKLIDECGLKIHKIMDAKNAVENTEFNNSYLDVPAQVANALRNRKDGEIYQFIWALKTKNM